MIEFISTYRYLIIPASLWFGIQLFKVLYEYFVEGKWNPKRFWGAGGMPSSHSAVVVSLATLIGKYQGVDSPIFALAVIVAFIVMYDACRSKKSSRKTSSTFK